MPAASKLRETSGTAGGSKGLLTAAGWLTAFVFAAPLAYLTWQAFAAGSLTGVLTDSEIAGPLLRSVVLAVTTAAIAGTLGSALAWLVVRTDLPGRRVVALAVALPLVIPSYVAAASLRAAFGPGGLVGWLPRPSGFWGSLVVLTAVTYPYVYLPVAARLQSMPASLEEAGRSLGDSPAAAIWRVVVPQARGAIMAGSMIVFLYAVSDFGAVSIMRYDTTTRAIFAARLAERGTALTLGLLVGLIALGVAAMSRDSAPGSGRIDRVYVYSLGRARGPLLAAVVALVGLFLVAPLAVFLVWWLRGSTGLDTGITALGQPALHSALAGVMAGAVAMAVLLPAAYLTATRRGRIAKVPGTLIASAFALPGLVLALAMVYWVLQAPSPLDKLYQSFPLLILAYVVHFGVQSHRASVTAIRALPARYGEAARMLGSGPMRRFLTVDLPLIAPGVLAGGGLVMLSTMKELPATLLLAPIGFDTLATRVWGAAEDGFLAEAGATSLVLVALSAALTWLLVLRPAGLTEGASRGSGRHSLR